MTETQTKRNGGQTTDMRDFADATRHLRDDARQLATSFGELSTQAQRVVTEVMQHRPYAALGAAVGVGFVLGGGLRSRLAGALFTLGGRYLVNTMAAQVTQPRRP